jgi:CubicO group peptidase (beta-lactamase class C family)
VVVGVIEGADSRVYGFARAGAPVPDGQTVYEIGSITKTFTGLLLAQAVKAGAARLDQPVAQLLPGAKPEPDEAGIEVGFKRDSAGKVGRLVLRQNGRES